MAWTPEADTLGQLAQLLQQSLGGRDRTAQKNAELTLKQAKSNPDMNNYLTFLTTHPDPIASMTTDSYHAARCAAAIMLKNNVRMSYKSIPDFNKTYVRSTILSALRDKSGQIRSYAGNVVTEMVKQGGVLGWPEVLSELMNLVESGAGDSSTAAQDGAMGAIMKICEDNRKALNKSYSGQRPLEFLVPKLLEFAKHPLAGVRSKALGTLNTFIVAPLPNAIVSNAENILLQLFSTASDSEEDVRRSVCRSFTALTNLLPNVVAPHLGGIIDYILIQQREGSDSEIALDAADFFYENGEKEELASSFAQHLSKIVPVLLASMIYSEDEQARLEAEAEEDAEEEDREQDIKPQFATAKATAGMAATSKGNDVRKPLNGYAYAEDDDLSEGEIDEFDDYGEDPEDLWNLRKSSAASLDAFSALFHRPVFEVTLPYLKDNLSHQNWPNREAAVLALGAISTGCMEEVQPHLPDLTRYLLTLLNDSQAVVRQITCWALGRYSSWAAHLEAAGKHEFFEPMMEGLLQSMLDKNKKVQQAASSAFANLEEEAKSELTPYGAVIIQQFVKCFDRYKDKNMFILYDCVQTLAENIGPEMARPELIDLLMPALITRWSTVADRSREMFPLLECLAYVASAMGPAFAPFSSPFFSRCVKIIHENLDEANAAGNNPVFDEPDKDFLVTSLDLLSAIIQALEPSRSRDLVANTQPNFFELLAYCMQDSNNDVRQSAYALLGDCSICVFGELQPYLPSIMKIVTLQLDITSIVSDQETAFRVINNACWSLGEIAMREQSGMGQYIEQVLQKLAMMLFSDEAPESLKENAAIALGRLGVNNDQQLAPLLASFAPTFLKIIRQVAWTDEKQHALQGFVNVVADNPQAMEQCLLPFFSELASAESSSIPKPEGAPGLFQLYKGMIPNFDEFLHGLPANEEQTLRQAYGL